MVRQNFRFRLGMTLIPHFGMDLIIVGLTTKCLSKSLPSLDRAELKKLGLCLAFPVLSLLVGIILIVLGFKLGNEIGFVGNEIAILEVSYPTSLTKNTKCLFSE